MASAQAQPPTTYSTSSMGFEERSLDALRYRMTSITNSLRDVYNDLLDPGVLLPAWERVLLPCHDLGRALSDLQALLHNERAFERDQTDRESGMTIRSEGYDLPRFLRTAHVHPTARFPRQFETALGGLITKRRAPMSDAWVDDVVKAARADAAGGEVAAGAPTAAELQDLWNWAPIEGNSIAREILYGGAGQQDDGEDDEDEDDDEDQDMEDVDGSTMRNADKQSTGEDQAASLMMPLEDIMRFISTGTVR